MKTVLITIAASAFLSGCTAALVDEARGREVPDNPQNYTTKIKAARIIHHDPYGQFVDIGICYASTNIKTGKNSDTELRIKFSYPEFRHTPTEFKRASKTSLTYDATGSDVGHPCGPTSDDEPDFKIDNLPVIEIGDNGSFTIPQGQDYAVYVKYREGHVEDSGFVGNKPFYGGSHSIAVNLPDDLLYTKRVDQKPALLLLTPITAVGDGVAGVIGVGAMAVTCGELELQGRNCR